ncbi:hypothetical protein [Alicyclobacillus pomorum]|jgi:hypothetical protein|uniref:hypothetical protein n=1 Tax=Alicyclobacillus pomorum TaxID=204470 RepID=UPI00040DBB1A|nr:hypothetical protein [Alicyclobacillus pomorum]
MDSTALTTFRRKMANPLHWRKANRILLGYTQSDLANLERAKHLIAVLAAEFDVSLTTEEQTEAAKWVVKQRMNPQSPRDRMSIWKKTK